MKKNTLLLIIFIEGYVVLSSELLAIRQVLPFVGNGVEIIAIIIGAVLLALSTGYYTGGLFTKNSDKAVLVTVQKKLIRNFLISATFFSVAFSYFFLRQYFFQYLAYWGIHNQIGLTLIYSLVFLIYPVYLIGQTLPLVSNYYESTTLSELTGRLLFFSTLGSFFGSFVTTSIFMALLGVNYTALIAVCLLLVSALLLLNRKNYYYIIYIIGIVAVAYFLNNQQSLTRLNVVKNNQFNTIAVIDDELGEGRTLSLNRSYSSYYSDNPDRMWRYLQYIEQNFIYPLNKDRQLPKDILILGAGGFTIGAHDNLNNYIFVDIDKDLKDVAEEKLLRRKLLKNKKFVAQEARAFLNQSKQEYDLIIVDIFSHGRTTPIHLLTEEYFKDIKRHLKPEGIVVINILASSVFRDKFSVKIDNTLRKVFYPLARQAMYSEGKYFVGNKRSNIIYSYQNHSHHMLNKNDIYSDNKNTYFMDTDHEVEFWDFNTK